MCFLLSFRLPSVLNSENLVIINPAGLFFSELTAEVWVGRGIMGANVLSEQKMPVVI